MQLANCIVIYNEFKASLPKYRITPAEAQLLILMHSDNAGECAVKNLEILPETVERTSAEERQRLCGIYPLKNPDPKRITIEKVWPGMNSKLPEKFTEVQDKDGKQVFLADGNMINSPAADTVILGGRTYKKADLEKLVATETATA